MNKEVIKLLEERYFNKHQKSWKDIAKNVGQIHKPFERLMLEEKACPSSPYLMNAWSLKNKNRGTFSSCFPLPIDDSKEAISKSASDAMFVTSAGGGCGWVFSKVRSRGEEIKSIEKPSGGVIPFIHILNSILDNMRQGGREKGAGAGDLDIFHPDSFEFIKVKSDGKNNKILKRFNLSLDVPDIFYQRLKNNPNDVFKVQEIVSKKWKPLLDENGKPFTYQSFWNRVIKYAWQSAEPGISNKDTAYRRCPVTNKYEDQTPNPCLLDNAPLLTKSGMKTLKEVNIGEEIWSKESWTTMVNKFPTGNKEVFEYTTKNGVFTSTENHEVEQNGKKIEIKNATGIDYFNSLSDHEFDDITINGTSKILSKKSIGFHDVWDITVDNDSHTFWCNGFSISNCHEFIAPPGSSCSLASMNLIKYLNDGIFDWQTFRNDIHITTEMLDTSIDKNKFPTEQIETVTKDIRPIGLGFMGMGSLLMLMGIPFNSDEASKLRVKISRFLTFASMEKSIELAKKFGPYPAYDKQTYLDANERFFKNKSNEIIEGIVVANIYNEIQEYGIRNSYQTSIAPNGTLSMIYEVTGGLEPEFGLSYSRKIENADGSYRKIYITNKIFEKFLDDNYKDEKEKILEYVSNNGGSVQGCKLMTEEHQKIFIVAKDMTPMEHLQSLADVETAVSLSASKTLNLPKDCTEKEISDVYVKAHELGIIGVSVYRDGSREGILHSNDDISINSENIMSIKSFEDYKKIYHTEHPDEEIIKKEIKLPNKALSETFTLKSEGKKFYVTVTYFENTFRPFAIFINTNDKIKNTEIKNVVNDLFSLIESKGIPEKTIQDQKDKIKESNSIDKFARSVSFALRHGIKVSEITKTIDDAKTGLGLVSRISKFLKSFLEGHKIAGDATCPNCGEKNALIHVSSCVECRYKCGYSACG